MGQQETTTMAVAAETKGGALRRMILVLAVAAVMVAMMAVTATSAFAAQASRVECIEGHGTFVLTPNGQHGHCTGQRV